MENTLPYTESHWHMIIGGKSGSNYIDSVELYNWQSGEQCQFAKLPEGFGLHSGAFFEGVPLVCGGSTGSAKADCYKYVPGSNYWLKVKSKSF
jgi:hypothetical protein